MTATLVTGVVRGCTDTPPDAPPVTVAADSPLGARTEAVDEKAAGRREPAEHGRADVIDLPPLTVRPVEEAPSPAPSRKPEAVRPPRPAPPFPAAVPPTAARGALELPRSPARQLAIPAIMIESPVMGLGLDGKGRLTAPPVDNPRLVGWYQKGPAPGENGTALMVGHRDTRTGPAIFLNLNALKPGDKVDVARSDRRTAVFTVDRVRTYKKEAFPDAEVYGHTGRPELRLLTCGGSFDKKAGYSANVVVFAHLTDVRQG